METVKRGDYIIIVLMILIALIPFGIRMARFSGTDAARTVTVMSGDEILYTGSADVDAVIETESGGNRIVIRNGEIFMEYADCPDQICVHSGKATPGKPLVCMPNRVTVTVTDSEDGAYDAVAG